MKKNIFLMIAVTALVAACSSDVEETIVAEKCPVRLSSKSLTGMTRAGQSVQLTQFDNGQEVGIFLAEDNGSGTAVTSGTNVTAYDQPLTYVANGSGGLTNTQYWPQDGNGLHIFGVYPLAAATAAASYSATGVSFSVQADQSTDANYMASDLMTGKPTDGNPVVRTNSAVPLTFTHLLTKINVNLTAGDGFTQAEMADAVVSILGTKLTTTFDVQGTTVGEASGTATTIAAGTGATTSAIIVPQTLAANTSFIQVAVG
ncbi:MAG: fimbrillin family protein, partial [Prevotella sp.]|nr:fimbrillin family protein [Prevotella sp.]